MSQQQKAMFHETGGPPGGLCLSSFVVVGNGTGVLAGKMAKPEIWTKRFYVGEKFAPTYASSGKLLIPARHLSWYESPLEAAESIMKDQALMPVRREDIKLLGVQSYVSGDPASKEKPPHWDICFVYQVRVPAGQAPGSPEWFSDFAFHDAGRLGAGDFARGHGEILEAAGAIKGASASI
jgi:hypothetical protein